MKVLSEAYKVTIFPNLRAVLVILPVVTFISYIDDQVEIIMLFLPEFVVKMKLFISFG
jgi:hypothetical protein